MAKAKELRPYADRVIRKAKNPNKLVAFVSVRRHLHETAIARKAVDKLADRYVDNNRSITKLTILHGERRRND